MSVSIQGVLAVLLFVAIVRFVLRKGLGTIPRSIRLAALAGVALLLVVGALSPEILLDGLVSMTAASLDAITGVYHTFAAEGPTTEIPWTNGGK